MRLCLGQPTGKAPVSLGRDQGQQWGDRLLPVPLPARLHLPTFRPEWSENGSPRCPDETLPTLGAPMAPLPGYQASPPRLGQAMEVGAEE